MFAITINSCSIYNFYIIVITVITDSATSNNEVGTLAVDGWAVTFGIARRSLGGLRPCSVPSSLYQM